MALVAVLDKNNILTGYRKKNKPVDTDVIVGDDCDLPTDGTYKWDGVVGAFVPLGHGFGRPKASKINPDRVLYLIAQSLGADMPQEVRDWVKWYDDNMARRDEELARKP